MAKYRRGRITSPANVVNVVNIEFTKNDTFDRRSADDSLTGDPVKTKQQGSGSFELCSGAWTDLYNASMTITVEDVSVANDVETITTRSFAFTKVTSTSGVNANNDGGESSRRVNFEFGAVTET
jgi:hypothetical protein